MTGMPVLPKAAYTTQTWFDREQRDLFSNVWTFAGFAEDLEKPGQTLNVQCGQHPLFVVKGRDHRLRAFHNLCRHRGTKLIRAVGRCEKMLTCPYHDWTYDLEGKLVSVPEERTEFPGLDKDTLGLHPAAVDIWRGMIWVHPDPGAPSLATWFAPMEPHLAPYDPTTLIEIEDAVTDHTIHANWKIVVENYIDGYHLSHLHSGTLAMYDHSRITSGFVGDHFAFFEPLAPDYAKDVQKNAPAPLIDERPADQLGAYVPMLFPNLGLGESESSWSIFHVIPVGPAETRVVTRTKMANASAWAYSRQAMRSASFWMRYIQPKYDGDPAVDPMATGDFMAEDILACEQQQAALASPLFSVGATAQTGEASVRGFQSRIQAWLDAHAPALEVLP